MTEPTISNWKIVPGDVHVDDAKHRLAHIYVRRSEGRASSTVCARCGEVLETTDDMSRWKYDGREWRHKCAKWQIVWRREADDALD